MRSAARATVSDRHREHANRARGRPGSWRIHVQSRRGHSERPHREYLIGGTTTASADYTALPASVIIPAGAATATVPVVPVDDTVVENNETVIVTITSGSGYILGSPASGTVSIVSDDVAPDMLVADLQTPRSAADGQHDQRD